MVSPGDNVKGDYHLISIHSKLLIMFINQQENEDVYPIYHTLQPHEPSPDGINMQTGQKMWVIKDTPIHANNYTDACEIYDFMVAASNFTL